MLTTLLYLFIIAVIIDAVGRIAPGLLLAAVGTIIIGGIGFVALVINSIYHFI